jgi:hypothetical protein
MTDRGKQLQAKREAVFLFIVIVGLDPAIQRFRTAALKGEFPPNSVLSPQRGRELEREGVIV